MRETDPDSSIPDDPLNAAWDADVLRAVAGLFGAEGVELLQEAEEPFAATGDELRELLAATDAAMAAWHEQAAATRSPRSVSPIRLEKCVLFRLRELSVTVALQDVLEILTVPRCTPLPGLPGWLRGIGNLRGQIVSVVDFRRFVGLPAQPVNPRQRLMLIHSRSADLQCGLIVDEVLGIRQRDQNRLQSPAAGAFAPLSHWITGVIEMDGLSAAALDLNRLMDSRQFRQLLPAPAATY